MSGAFGADYKNLSRGFAADNSNMSRAFGAEFFLIRNTFLTIQKYNRTMELLAFSGWFSASRLSMFTSCYAPQARFFYSELIHIII